MAEEKNMDEKNIEFKNYIDEFKKIVNNNHFTDNELMWVFMFYINRIAEQYTIDGKGMKIALYRHKDGGGSWNFDMEEVYEKEKDYPISENWFGNPQLGIQGICHPTCWYYSDEEIMNAIKKYGSPHKNPDPDDKFPVWCNSEVIILYMKDGYLTYATR